MPGRPHPDERTTDVVEVTGDQARSFRLKRHGLLTLGRRKELVRTVSEMGGTQAQLLSAAELSLWARTADLRVGDVGERLWNDRTLSKAWCMRRTLHLLPSADVSVFVRGSARRAAKEIRWTLRHGVTEALLRRLLEAAESALDVPVTRTEMVERICRSLGRPVSWEAAGGWGSPRKVPCVSLGAKYLPGGYILHLLGERAVVCSGPDRGSESTYVRAASWLPGWRDLSPARAEEELVRRYLRSFGPATVKDFVAWTRMTVSDARGIWDRISEEVAPVAVDGVPAGVLRSDLSTLEAAQPIRGCVRLLPYFDSYLLGHMERRHLVQEVDHRKVYRNQGWVAPVLLVDGTVRGVWQHEVGEGTLTIRVYPFGQPDRSVSSALRLEGERLSEFLGCSRVEIVTHRGP